MKLADIKDKSPNLDTISQLEYLLEEAKKGELRSIFTICEWTEAGITHGWVMDKRSPRKLFIAELAMAQHDFMVNTELEYGHSILARSLLGDE